MKFKDLILLLLLNFFSLPKKKTFILYIINTSNILVGIYLTPFWSVGVALGLHLGGTFLSTTCVVLCVWGFSSAFDSDGSSRKPPQFWDEETKAGAGTPFHQFSVKIFPFFLLHFSFLVSLMFFVLILWVKVVAYVIVLLHVHLLCSFGF